MLAVSIVLVTSTLVMIFGLLVATAAAKLARMDGATYPAALMRGAATLAAVLTLAAAVTGALASVFT